MEFSSLVVQESKKIATEMQWVKLLHHQCSNEKEKCRNNQHNTRKGKINPDRKATTWSFRGRTWSSRVRTCGSIGENCRSALQRWQICRKNSCRRSKPLGSGGGGGYGWVWTWSCLKGFSLPDGSMPWSCPKQKCL